MMVHCPVGSPPQAAPAGAAHGSFMVHADRASARPAAPATNIHFMRPSDSAKTAGQASVRQLPVAPAGRLTSAPMGLWSKVKGALAGGSPDAPAETPPEPAALPSAEDQFAARVAAAIAKVPSVTAVTRGEGLSLTFTFNGEPNSAFLGNLF